ncbi:hypothetical protein WP8S17C03_22840 [Metapseudomonas otitidis]|uniref:Uncharacterized protein n=1 Tax=Metapseudomonas otitidis TaxID=319939 RepID=A0A6S5RTN3_9GAMM|nr:hypothetical protein [Pseudomonas otitidis]BBT16235.1 hypothetical protein WP8S17C03_22840 [Pseudomonas otitidis]
MAILNDPRAMAYRVLARYGDRDNVRVGDVLRLNNFQGLKSASVDGEDLQAGLEFCVEQGWLTVLTSESLELTQAGFDEIQG